MVLESINMKELSINYITIKVKYKVIKKKKKKIDKGSYFYQCDNSNNNMKNYYICRKLSYFIKNFCKAKQTLERT